MGDIMLDKEDGKSKRKGKDRVIPLTILFLLICAVELSAVCTYAFDTLANGQKISEEIEHNKYELLSKELGVDEKNIIIEEQKSKNYDLVLTSKGDYRVVFSNLDDPDKLKLERVLKD